MANYHQGPGSKWASKQALHQMKQYTGQIPKDHMPPTPLPPVEYNPPKGEHHGMFNGLIFELDSLIGLPAKVNMTPRASKFPTSGLAAFAATPAANTSAAPWGQALPKTQKARGVLYGRMIGHRKWGVSAEIKSQPRNWDDNPIQVFPGKSFKMPKYWPQFARPCPVRPRHGFVESRKVNDMAEAMKVLNETLLVEREAELILMPVLSGKYSAVATNAGVVWGWGNDGATSKPGGVLIPASSSGQLWSHVIRQQADQADAYNKAIELAEGLITDTAYLEVVEDNAHTHIVQVRDGPEQKAAKNWIPDTRVVNTILTPDGPDLLKWEQKVRDYAGSGTVVYLQDHTLSDHFAVHAIAAGLPVVTDAYPTLGSTLEPEELIVKWTHEDYTTLASRLRGWLMEDYFPPDHYSGVRNRLMTAVGTMHAMGTWAPEPHLINMMANAMASLLRASASATAGEMRHWYINGPYRNREEDDDDEENTTPGKEHPTGDYPFAVEFWSGVGNRDQVYTHFFEPHALDELNKLHAALADDFKIPGWAPSYGGERWADVATAGLNLGLAIKAFIESPDPDGDLWAQVAQTANTFVHTAHNNGVALNKWLLGLDDFVQHPQLAWLNPYAAQLALNYGKAFQ